MRDDPRKPSPHTSKPSEPSPSHPAARERHPALRPRLGGGPGDIREEELSAFSSRPQDSTPAKAAAPVAPSQETAVSHGPRAGKTGRKAEAGEALESSGSASAGAPAAGPARKMVRKKRAPRSAAAKLKRFTLLVLVPCALAGTAGWALSSPRLAVSGVDVAGVDSTPEALVQPISQALTGQNWLRADMAAARSRLAKLPTVEFATVSRAWDHWPPRLSVRIQERRPWLRVGGGGSWWIVDRSGVAFRRATREDRELYAVTSTAFDPESLRVGQKIQAQIWDDVRRLGQALDESSRRGGPWEIKRAYLDRDGMASLRLRGGSQDGLLVRLGDGLWPQKMERARRALLFFEAAGRRAASLNLVSFSMPTWTPLQPASAAPKASPGTNRDSTRAGEARADNTTTTAPTTPADTSNTASENADDAASSTSGAPEAATSTSSGQDNAPGAPQPAQEQPGASENQAADGSKQRGGSHGASDGAGATA